MWNWFLQPLEAANQRLALLGRWLFVTLLWNIGGVVVVGSLIPKEGVYDHAEIGWIALPLTAFVVMFEELIRLGVLAAVVAISRHPVVVMLGTVVTAALFGAAHVSNGLPLWSTLLFQGVTGLIMNLLYLKCGGLHGDGLRGFRYALTFHIAFDFILLVPMLLLQGT